MDEETKELIRQRFIELPKVLQDAITSADVVKRMRDLADMHKLHLDQWQKLENEVMLALLGVSPVEALAENLQEHASLDEATATVLAADISKTIFEPIREELAKELGNPKTEEKGVSNVEALRTQILAEEPTGNQPPSDTALPEISTVTPPQSIESSRLEPSPAPSPVKPATPPPPPPIQKIGRGPASGAYKPGEASTTRKSIVDDPYREPPK